MKSTILLLVMCLCFAVMVSYDAWAAELPVGDSQSWHTVLYATALPNASAPVEVDSLCTRQRATVVPDGAAKLDLSLCGTAEYGLVPAPADVESFVRLIFNDGIDRSTYTVPPLSAWHESRRVIVETGANVATYATIFCSVRTPMTATVYAADNPHSFVREYFECAPPVSQYRILRDGLGFAKFSIGYDGILVPANLPDVHGFVVATDERGFGNAAAVPLQPATQ